MDFGALPPEINSGRMYAGAGSGPMLAAASAWDGLASDLGSTASSYHSVIDGLAESWQGPTPQAMAAAVRPYVTWMSATAMQAEQTATQAKLAAAAYETAFAATVPPPVIAANRSLLATLIATNFLGQNTAAIAATESHYAEMWAQDAAAMYGYAGSAASASQITPFNQPPQTTNPGGAATQAASVGKASTGGVAQAMQAMSATPHALQSLTSPVTAAASSSASSSLASSLNTISGFITGPLSPLSLFTVPGVPFLLGIQLFLLPFNAQNLAGALAKASKPVAPTPPTASPVLGDGLGAGLGSGAQTVRAGGTAVSAGLGNASMAGNLSVPQSWATAAPGAKPVATVSPGTSVGAAPAIAAQAEGEMFSPMAMSALAGRAMAGTGGTATARSLGVRSNSVTTAEPDNTVNIIVIPEDDE